MLLSFLWASLDLYNENNVVPISTKYLYTAYIEEEWYINSNRKIIFANWTNSCAFQTRLILFSGMPPQLTGPFEVSLKAEWSVLGLAVLWGVLIPRRWASRGVSVWLNSFLITPEWSEQLLLLHICVSISRTYGVTHAGRTGPRGAPVLPSAHLAPQLHSAVWVSLSIFGSFNFRLNLTIFFFFSPGSKMMFVVVFITAGRVHQAKNKSLSLHLLHKYIAWFISFVTEGLQK